MFSLAFIVIFTTILEEFFLKRMVVGNKEARSKKLRPRICDKIVENIQISVFK